MQQILAKIPKLFQKPGFFFGGGSQGCGGSQGYGGRSLGYPGLFGLKPKPQPWSPRPPVAWLRSWAKHPRDSVFRFTERFGRGCCRPYGVSVSRSPVPPSPGPPISPSPRPPVPPSPRLLVEELGEASARQCFSFHREIWARMLSPLRSLGPPVAPSPGPPVSWLRSWAKHPRDSVFRFTERFGRGCCRPYRVSLSRSPRLPVAPSPRRPVAPSPPLQVPSESREKKNFL